MYFLGFPPFLSFKMSIIPITFMRIRQNYYFNEKTIAFTRKPPSSFLTGNMIRKKRNESVMIVPDFVYISF